MYRFTGINKSGHSVQPFPGIPLESSDKEFAEALREFEALNGEGNAEAIRKSGLYEHVSEAATAPAKDEG